MADGEGSVGGKRQARVVCEATMDEGWQLEYSVHKMNAILANDARATFTHELEPIITKMAEEQGKTAKEVLVERLLGVPTWQPAPSFETLSSGDWASPQLDLSVYPSQEVNKVRKALYLKVFAWVGAVRKVLERMGYWADGVCPITGHSMFGGRTSNVFNELEGLTMMLGYDAIPIGCCGIVLHPRWGRCAYPATLFTVAPLDSLQQAIKEVAAMPEIPQVQDEVAKECVDGDSCM